MKLTDRDRDIIQSLSACVRMFHLGQIAAHWWPTQKNARESARRRLAKLISGGLLTTTPVLAADLPELSGPVLQWMPGDAPPDLGAAAWILQSRWTTQPKRRHAYLATAAAAKLFGGKATGRLKHQYQATHDFGVAQMFLQLRVARPKLAQDWVGEDVLAPQRRGQKLPDAIINPSNSPQLVLEFGGAYNKARLLDFHQDCQLRVLPYEIW